MRGQEEGRTEQTYTSPLPHGFPFSEERTISACCRLLIMALWVQRSQSYPVKPRRWVDAIKNMGILLKAKNRNYRASSPHETWRAPGAGSRQIYACGGSFYLNLCASPVLVRFLLTGVVLLWALVTSHSSLVPPCL